MKQVELKTRPQVPRLCRYNLFSSKMLIYGAAASAAPFDPLWQILPFVSADPSPVTEQQNTLPALLHTALLPLLSASPSPHC